MKNVFVKDTFLKTSDVNTTTALSTYGTSHPLSTFQRNEIYYFNSLNYYLQHWACCVVCELLFFPWRSTCRQSHTASVCETFHREFRHVEKPVVGQLEEFENSFIG